jgi:hypothetical protein
MGPDVTFGETARWVKHHGARVTLLPLAHSGSKASEVTHPSIDLASASMQGFPARRSTGEHT